MLKFSILICISSRLLLDVFPALAASIQSILESVPNRMD